MFSRNSPIATSKSPRNKILSILFRTFFASSTVSINLTLPSFNLTRGGMIPSTGVMIAPLPGLSVFNCIPIDKKFSVKIIMAGCTPNPARPVFLERPYLSLNPPMALGDARTGLPAITSLRYFLFGSTFFFFSLFPDSGSFFASENASSHSQPSIPAFLTIFSIFFAFRITPSFNTRTAPPLTLLVSIVGIFLYWPETSTSIVPSPVISIGRCLNAYSSFSLSGVYCKFMNRSYKNTSSMKRSNSRWDMLYLGKPIAFLTMSAITTVRAASVPPADLIGPA